MESCIGFGGNSKETSNIGISSKIDPMINIDDELSNLKKLRHTILAGELKYMSYEGSLVICVLLALNSPAVIELKSLPDIDKELIINTISKTKNININFSCFLVKFDKNKNFIITGITTNGVKNLDEYNIINTVANPRPEDLEDLQSNIVKVNEDGDNIEVGDSIILNKNKISKFMKLSGINNNNEKNVDHIEQEKIPKRQVVSGRNAFEIRSDILTLAVDWSIYKKVQDENEVLSIAKKFYSFVENKR